MVFVNIRVIKVTPVFGLKLQNVGPFNAGPFVMLCYVLPGSPAGEDVQQRIDTAKHKPFCAGPFHAASQKLTPLKNCVLRANKVLR